MTQLNAIDTSHYQEDNKPEIDFTASPDVSLWILKATQGISYVDPRFSINREKIRNIKKYRGAYHFLSSNYSIQSQMQHFSEVVGGLAVGEFLMIDAERDNITGTEVTEDQVFEAVTYLEQRFGPRVAVYCGVHTAGGTIWKSTRIFNGSRARILAAYVNETQAKVGATPYAWDMWQYSSDGPAPGVTGRCDLNRVDNWDIFNFISGTFQDVGEEMKIITNSEVRSFEGVEYNPGVIKWGLMLDGSKRHLTEREFSPMYEIDTKYPLPNTQLDVTPDYSPVAATCSFHGGSWPVSLSGSISAR